MTLVVKMRYEARYLHEGWEEISEETYNRLQLQPEKGLLRIRKIIIMEESSFHNNTEV